MKVIIRADSSTQLGIGHMIRCLTLAELLRAGKVDILFVCAQLQGNIAYLASSKGFALQYIGAATADEDAEQVKSLILEQGSGVDLVVVDSYKLDGKWERCLRPYTKRIMVIDDLADRLHDCDILLDQNLLPHMDRRYEQLVPAHCIQLLGPSHALLRKEFIVQGDKMASRDGTIRRILISFGGSDPTGETGKALQALASLDCLVDIDVVVGNPNIAQEELRQICSKMERTSLYCQVNNMAELMAKSDLIIGGGGISTWERCYLGLPSITIITADNQIGSTVSVAAAGATWNLGMSDQVTAERIRSAVDYVLANPSVTRTIGENAHHLIGPLKDNQVRLVRLIMGD